MSRLGIWRVCESVSEHTGDWESVRVCESVGESVTVSEYG